MADSDTDLRPQLPIEGVVYRADDEVRALLRDGGWAARTVGDLLRAAAQADPTGEAVVSGDQRLTWSELDLRADRLAAGLLGEGIEPAERVLVQLPTNAETVITLVALFKAGIVPVCAVPQYREFEMFALCERSGAVAHVVTPTDDLLALARRLPEQQSSLRRLLTSAPAAAGTTLAEVEARGARLLPGPGGVRAPSHPDVVAFQLCGGTTGVPKIIPRFHGEYVAYAQAFAEAVGLTQEDRFLWSLPITHNAGMLLVLVPCLATRATMVLLEGFDPATFLGTIAAEAVTITGSVGPITPRVLAMDVSPENLSSVRHFITLNRAAELEAHLGVPVVNLYGTTEGLVMTSHSSDPPERRHRSVGAPISPRDEARVLGSDDDDVVFGEQGELCFRGPSTLTGYVADDAATAAAFTSRGFFRTGDLVREHMFDGARCFSFEGRIKENIDRGGEKFGTEEIENLLAEHEAILEARIVAMPDPVLGERACAFVIPRPGRRPPDVAAMGAFLLERGLAKFKLPERVEHIDAFPVTNVGKLDRGALRKQIAALLAHDLEGTL
jgi:non-ribosomal peptide synthetase component E (peptide arylation enzyme)